MNTMITQRAMKGILEENNRASGLALTVASKLRAEYEAQGVDPMERMKAAAIAYALEKLGEQIRAHYPFAYNAEGNLTPDNEGEEG